MEQAKETVTPNEFLIKGYRIAAAAANTVASANGVFDVGRGAVVGFDILSLDARTAIPSNLVTLKIGGVNLLDGLNAAQFSYQTYPATRPYAANSKGIAKGGQTWNLTHNNVTAAPKTIYFTAFYGKAVPGANFLPLAYANQLQRQGYNLTAGAGLSASVTITAPTNRGRIVGFQLDLNTIPQDTKFTVRVNGVNVVEDAQGYLFNNQFGVKYSWRLDIEEGATVVVTTDNTGAPTNAFGSFTLLFAPC